MGSTTAMAVGAHSTGMAVGAHVLVAVELLPFFVLGLFRTSIAQIRGAPR